MKAYLLNNISKTALKGLKAPDGTVDNLNDADCVLVRSANMLEMPLGKNVLAVARAGAGVNNIPLDAYAKQGVVVFNTPGANANAVKELVICALLLSCRDVIGGNKWIKDNAENGNIAKDAEKAKAKFAGTEIKGKTIAVIGLGTIGVLVANAAIKLGMKVVGYDPYLSLLNAMHLDKSVDYREKLTDAVKNADFITVHVPASEKTAKMINADVISAAKKGAVLVNFSRDSLVDEDAVLAALSSGKLGKYVTDFANPNVVKFPNTIIFPHLGASTEEAEDNCAVMAIEELKDFLENGNIAHSVNYPDLDAGKKGDGKRITICHKNVPGMIANFTTAAFRSGANIVNLVNKGRGDYAYSVLDVEGEIDADEIAKIDGVFRVRVL